MSEHQGATNPLSLRILFSAPIQKLYSAPNWRRNEAPQFRWNKRSLKSRDFIYILNAQKVVYTAIKMKKAGWMEVFCDQPFHLYAHASCCPFKISALCRKHSGVLPTHLYSEWWSVRTLSKTRLAGFFWSKNCLYWLPTGAGGPREHNQVSPPPRIAQCEGTNFVVLMIAWKDRKSL